MAEQGTTFIGPALESLSRMLRSCEKMHARPMPSGADLMEGVVTRLRQQTGSNGVVVPEDLKRAAVAAFWNDPHIRTPRDGRLVSFGLCDSHGPGGQSIIEDKRRFRAVLDAQTGIEKWSDKPVWFRRCYQGLLHSYFLYDPDGEQTAATGRENWHELRGYLKSRVDNLVAARTNPDWVGIAREHCAVLGANPCDPYARDLLEGREDRLESLRNNLSIDSSSWFLRDLVLAQVRHATSLGHDEFKSFIPQLLRALGANKTLRDRGLVMVLDKYAEAQSPLLHEELRDNSVDWWGTPWLPSTAQSWAGVTQSARDMVSEWLRREFIEAFFTKLAEDGVGDRRRANFWLKYVKSMGDVRFALGSKAFYSRNPDFVALRQKMRGLYVSLECGVAENNAFIMTMGNLVAVEFGAHGNAFYAYDSRKNLPFEVKKPLYLAVDAPNSLKHSSRLMKLRHQDDIHGFATWEDMFARRLQDHFGVRPGQVLASPHMPRTNGPASSPPPSPSRAPVPAAVQAQTPHLLSPATAARPAAPPIDPFRSGTPYSKAALNTLARSRFLTVEDNSDRNGNLWVRTDDRDPGVNRVLRAWGFNYKAPKGWWR